MTHLQNGKEYQLLEKYNGKKELYHMNSNKVPTQQQHKNNSKIKDTPIMIESRYDISTLRAISETMLARHHSKKRSPPSRELHYHNKKKNRIALNDMEKTKYIMDSPTSSFSSLIPLKSPYLPQVIRRFTATATSLRSTSPSHSPTQANGTRHSTSSVQPRWHNQACMLFLALRDHPQHEMPRTELINAALELDKNISKEKKLPHAFRGKTPKNSASAILTNNHGKHFQAFRPDGSRSMHFRLTFKPANFMKASKQYREWLDILYKHDWPLCFGRPQQDTNENNDSKSLNSPSTPHPTATVTATAPSSSSSPPNEINNTSITTATTASSLISSISEKNTKSTYTKIPSCESTSSTATDDTSLLPTPPISNSPSFDQDFSENKNQVEISVDEDEDQDEGIISFKSHPTEFDYFMALRQQERERLTMNSADEYNKENQIVDQSMLPSPTYHYPFNNSYYLHGEFNQNKKNTNEEEDNDQQQQQQLNGSNISICDTISWKIVGDSYYLTSSDTPVIPTSWRDIVRVEQKYTIKGDTYYTVYANRRLPCNIPIGFYFGVPVSEEEFDLFKEDNGQALSTSVMYGKTILDPTDDYGQLFMDPNQEQTKVYCPFNFIREADTPERSNISLLKGRIHNQVICWTQREIAKDEELLTWLEYNHI